MKKIFYLIIGFCMIYLVSCDSNKIYQEHQELSPLLEWKKDLKIEFKPVVSDTNAFYNIKLAFRHGTGFQYKSLKVKLTTITPSGISTKKDYEIKIADENNQFLGEGMGDIWDLEAAIETNYKFTEIGEYIFVAEQTMPGNTLQLAADLGLIIHKK